MPHVPAIAALAATAANQVQGGAPSASLRNWKVAFAALLFAEGLVFAHVVHVVRRFAGKSNRSFGLATHFGHALSAGVFFATGMLHILPEAIELMSGAAEAEGHAEGDRAEEGHAEDGDAHGDAHTVAFPWSFFVVLVGFYTLFFLKQILPAILSGESGRLHGAADSKADVEDVKEIAAAATDGAEVQHVAATAASPAGAATGAVSDGVVGEETVDLELLRPIGKDAEISPPPLEHRFLSPAFSFAVLHILGLSAHSLFESMALGISSDFSTVLNVFIATAAHRWATSVAIAFTCASTLSYGPFLAVFVLFSAMVPLGVGVGMALHNLSAQLQGVLFALSAATFLYIGVFETMTDEFVLHRDMMGRKFLMTLAGASIIVVTTAILVSLRIHG